ncbi:MAG: Anthranilate synthase, amidotransferase component @ Para-aminobenzoate synthase, amidotransferase component, partial [uncultured Thermoleophilia bacterium]
APRDRHPRQPRLVRPQHRPSAGRARRPLAHRPGSRHAPGRAGRPRPERADRLARAAGARRGGRLDGRHPRPGPGRHAHPRDLPRAPVHRRRLGRARDSDRPRAARPLLPDRARRAWSPTRAPVAVPGGPLPRAGRGGAAARRPARGLGVARRRSAGRDGAPPPQPAGRGRPVPPGERADAARLPHPGPLRRRLRPRAARGAGRGPGAGRRARGRRGGRL